MFCLDNDSQMSFRQVCQSWKAQLDHPQFWMKKLDLKGCQPKEIQKEWIDFVGRVQKGSKLEKEVTECFMKLYGEQHTIDAVDGMTPIFMAARFDAINIVKFIASFKISHTLQTIIEKHPSTWQQNVEALKFSNSWHP